MKDLIRELIPHAPHLGLYVVPNIPADKRRNALQDYAKSVGEAEVLALYDATLMGSAKDGAVFMADRFVFENSNLEAAQEVRYEDVVRVVTRKKLLGGQKIELDVNRGRATVNLAIDFSGKPEAAEYVARFLNEAMMQGAAGEMDARSSPASTQASPFPRPGVKTDLEAVRAALDELQEQELLAAEDYHKLRAAIGLE